MIVVNTQLTGEVDAVIEYQAATILKAAIAMLFVFIAYLS